MIKAVFTVGCLLAIGVVIWALLPEPVDSAVRPITEYPKTRRIAPEEWLRIVTSSGLETGDVLIPAAFTGTEFHSEARAAARGFLSPDVCGECHQQNH